MIIMHDHHTSYMITIGRMKYQVEWGHEGRVNNGDFSTVLTYGEHASQVLKVIDDMLFGVISGTCDGIYSLQLC
jgi:hypothetical protein